MQRSGTQLSEAALAILKLTGHYQIHRPRPVYFYTDMHINTYFLVLTNDTISYLVEQKEKAATPNTQMNLVACIHPQALLIPLDILVKPTEHAEEALVVPSPHASIFLREIRHC